MAINKATKAALKALSYPDPDIKKSYKIVRKIDKLTSGRLKSPHSCKTKTLSVEREGYQIPVRIYTPVSTAPKGVILFFHGGGWVNGDIDTYAVTCDDIGQSFERIVLSVDYRRAPEFKFPTAPKDCYAVAKELFDGKLIPGYLPEEIILMGDSAGGNLAAAVSLMAHDSGDFKPGKQILIYPSTGNDHSPDSPFESVRTNGTDYLLTSKRIVGYMELYASSKEDFQNPYLAPLLAKDLHGQPDTLIITAEYCPLRDEGEEYGKRLADAGNKVQVYRMPDALHGYFTLPLKFKPQKKTYSVIRRFLGDDVVAVHRTPGWIRLDNAAKIFPPTTTKHDSRVFRFYCELNDGVDGHALQAALDASLELFPFYLSILKKGIFWYYFESTSLKPLVREEYKEPCSAIFDINRKDLLFEVTYYKNRINFEVYHALTDGGGAAKFMQTLVTLYLKRMHLKELSGLKTENWDATVTEKKVDSFFKYYKDRKMPRSKHVAGAYRICGERLEGHPLGIIEGEIPVSALLTKAHEYNSTLTAFLVAVLLRAIYEGMPLREQSKPIVITIPVDLRQYYESKTARNFFGIINVGYNFSKQSGELPDIIVNVSRSMKESLDAKRIGDKMTGLIKIENMMPARLVPLVFKDPSLKIANYVADRGVTAAFSNLGVIKMPEETLHYINKFGVICSTRRIQACMCSFSGKFVISFSSPFASADIQCRFFRILTKMGIETQITSNLGSDKNVVL